MARELPSGTVTFLFTDVEGSTRLLHDLGDEGYARELAAHRHTIREACARYDGVEVDTQGDAFFFAFPTAPGALAAAEEMTRELAPGPIRVRIGLHTGTPVLTAEGYVGGDVHRAARIAASGHGGQVLVSQSTASLVETELTDLGDHRFKDLSAAERVYQLGSGVFPALSSLYRTNLPVPTTPFLGRERELVEVVGLLEGARLLTLTGPGGTGKTRLAAQAAGMASDAYPAGVWWIPLAALRDSALVLETAAQVVGSKNGIAEHIADKEMLLLFDNFEQVVEAAEAVSGLLASCPNLDLLVTSREPLHVTGEQEYPVPPLVHEEGVGFFLARARAVKPGFQADDAVSEICSRLDDLPLALELAAARVKALSSAQILERLEQRLPLLTGGARDLPERQRTLRGAIAWSYELLNEEEQRLFSRLSVFRGGCTLEAAEEVCQAELDRLQSLVDKSLVRHTDERYWMLETIREYAAERLEESDDAEELRRRHARHFLALSEAVGGLHFYEGAQPLAMDRLAAEVDNTRAAIEWCLQRQRDDDVLRFGKALWLFWTVRGYDAEGRRWLERPVVTGKRDGEQWIWGASALSELDRGLGDNARARELKQELLPIARRLGEVRLVAGTLADLADLALTEGDFQQARVLLEESLTLRDHPLAARGLGRTLSSLGELALREGDLARAESLFEEAVNRSGEWDPESGHTGGALMDLGEVRLLRGDDAGAEAALREALRIADRLGLAWGVAHCLEDLGAVALHRGQTERAAKLAGAADALRKAEGLPRDPSWGWSTIVETLGEPLPEDAWAAGARLTTEEAIALASGS
jgi:predicted ATPase